LEAWTWFRSVLVELHDWSSLPETFGPEEGTIAQGFRDDDDFMRPVEFNENWRTQEIVFEEGRHRALVSLNQDEQYDWFSIRHELDGHEVKLFVSFREQSLTVSPKRPDVDAWRDRAGR